MLRPLPPCYNRVLYPVIRNPLSIAFDEIARRDVSYDPSTIDVHNH